MMRRAVVCLVCAVVLMLVSVPDSVAQSARPDEVRPAAIVAPPVGLSDEDPLAVPSVYVPAKYRARVPSAPVPGANAGLLFTPMDNNGNATIIIFTNSKPRAAVMRILFWDLTGALVSDTSIAVPALGQVRVCTDDLTAGFPASWDDMILINTTDFVSRGQIIGPTSVKVDAYVAWSGTSTHDPRAQIPTYRIRFKEPSNAGLARRWVSVQDNNENGTALFFYNTTGTAATVQVAGYTLAGVKMVDFTIPVPAGQVVRWFCDTLAVALPPSWVGTITTNLGDDVSHVLLTLPTGVKVDGYIAWTAGAAYDPNVAVPVTELVFIK